MNAFALNLRRLMKDKKIDQGELANVLGVNRSSISQWVTGRTMPRGKKLEQLAEVLGVSVNELFIEEAGQQVSEAQSKDARIRELEQQLLKTTQELLEYKTRENEKLKNHPPVSAGQ